MFVTIEKIQNFIDAGAGVTDENFLNLTVERISQIIQDANTLKIFLPAYTQKQLSVILNTPVVGLDDSIGISTNNENNSSAIQSNVSNELNNVADRIYG